MDLNNFLSLVSFFLLILFFLLLIVITTLSVQTLIILKRILSKLEYHLDNLKITESEIKIKILDFIETVLKKIRGGEINAERETRNKEVKNP